MRILLRIALGLWLTLTSASETHSYRVRVSPFTILLEGTIHEFSQEDLNDLHRLVESTMEAYIQPKDNDLRYVLMGDISSDTPEVVDMGVGVVSFAGRGDEPSPDQVNTWVEEAINANLASYLQNSEEFYYITDAAYYDPNARQPLPGGLTRGEAPVSSGSDAGAGLYVGVTLACVLSVLLVALFVQKKRRRAMAYEDEAKQQEIGASPARTEVSRDSLPSPMVPIPSLSMTDDSIVNDSDSEWTVNTEAGDSAVLQSVLPTPPPIVAAESFDRPVHLRKDMLTSAWSGRAPSARQPQSESVLKPSHFSVATESSSRQGFIFQQANENTGEEIYLMPQQRMDIV